MWGYTGREVRFLEYSKKCRNIPRGLKRHISSSAEILPSKMIRTTRLPGLLGTKDGAVGLSSISPQRVYCPTCQAVVVVDYCVVHEMAKLTADTKSILAQTEDRTKLLADSHMV